MISPPKFAQRTSFLSTFKNIISHNRVILAMAVRELRARTAGTIGGFFWSVATPIATLCIYWAVFSLGFKVGSVDNVSFAAYLICGITPWFAFQEMLTTTVSSVSNSSHLVKKVQFPVEILPIVSLAVATITHTVMIGVLVAVVLFSGHDITVNVVYALYYFLCLVLFSLGAGWLTSSLNVFSKDVANGIALIANIWFWLTPIVWVQSMLPARFEWLLMLNPVFYIIDGYRDSFLHGVAPWDKGIEHVVFWVQCLVLLFVGHRIFHRLRPKFAEYL